MRGQRPWPRWPCAAATAAAGATTSATWSPRAEQFAPSIVPPGTRLGNSEAWAQAVDVALGVGTELALPIGQRKEVVPGASHFMAHAIASPTWRNAYQVATIGDHTFLRVQKLKPRKV